MWQCRTVVPAKSSKAIRRVMPASFTLDLEAPRVNVDRVIHRTRVLDHPLFDGALLGNKVHYVRVEQVAVNARIHVTA